MHNEIKTKDLMENNILFLNLGMAIQFLLGGEYSGGIIIPIDEVKDGDLTAFIPYAPDPEVPGDQGEWAHQSFDEGDILPVSLEYTKLLEDLGVDLKILEEIPTHINYLHQLQNWYLLTKNTPLVYFEKFDDEDGDFWIRTTEEYCAWCEKINAQEAV